MMKYHLLIDGDVLVYMSGFANEKSLYDLLDVNMQKIGTFNDKRELKKYVADKEIEAYSIVQSKDIKEFDQVAITLHQIINNIKENVAPASVQVFLSGKGNFREKLYPEYKANREDYQKPYHFKMIREYMVDQLKATVVDGQEADDAMGIAQWNYLQTDEQSVIVTIDKDLNMIPGLHYSPREGELHSIDECQAMRLFYRQVLTGDRVDNIPGIKGMGPKKAEKLVPDQADVEQEMYDVCQKAYEDHGLSLDDMHLNGQLLWIRRQEGEIWEPNKYEISLEV